VANARLRQVIEAKDTEVLVLREQLEVLRAEVAELQARLGATSRNSCKPPAGPRVLAALRRGCSPTAAGRSRALGGLCGRIAVEHDFDLNYIWLG
jgi:hypothetical protein